MLGRDPTGARSVASAALEVGDCFRVDDDPRRICAGSGTSRPPNGTSTDASNPLKEELRRGIVLILSLRGTTRFNRLMGAKCCCDTSASCLIVTAVRRCITAPPNSFLLHILQPRPSGYPTGRALSPASTRDSPL